MPRWHSPAKALMQRRKAGGDSGRETLRVLQRSLSEAVYAALRQDLTPNSWLFGALTEEAASVPHEPRLVPNPPADSPVRAHVRAAGRLR